MPSLTGLLFSLVLWVVIFHQSFNWQGFKELGQAYLAGAAAVQVPYMLWPYIGIGYVAVNAFFILSGFILSYNYPLGERWSVRRHLRYFVARFARIYPVYLLGLLLVAPFILHGAIEWRDLAWLKELLWQLLLSLGLVHAWVPDSAISWNSPGWSLSAEAFFYCCFPWIGMILWRVAIARLLIVMALLWAVGLAAPTAIAYIPAPSLGTPLFRAQTLEADQFGSGLVQWNPLLRLPDFGLGIALGRVYNWLVNPNSRLWGRGYFLCAAGLLFGILAIPYLHQLPRALLLNGVLSPLHVFLWLNYLAFRLFDARLGGISNLILYIELVCLAAVVVCQYIEEPANRFLPSRLGKRSGTDDSAQVIAMRSPAARITF